MVREFCGDEALKNVVLVTNMWSEVTTEVGEKREKQLSSQFFKPVLDLGAQMVRHQNTVQSAHDIIRRMLANDPLALQIQRELVDDHKDIANTAAGEAVNQELNEQIRRGQAELKVVQEEMEQAMKEKDEQTRRELEEERRKLEEQMEKVKRDSEGMAASYAAEKERMAAKMREIEQEAEKEREQADAEYHRQSADLNRRPQGVANASTVGRPWLKQVIGRRQNLPDESDDGWITIPIYM